MSGNFVKVKKLFITFELFKVQSSKDGNNTV